MSWRTHESRLRKVRDVRAAALYVSSPFVPAAGAREYSARAPAGCQSPMQPIGASMSTAVHGGMTGSATSGVRMAASVSCQSVSESLRPS